MNKLPVFLLVHLAYSFLLLPNNTSSLNLASVPRNTSTNLEERVLHCFLPEVGRVPPRYEDCETAVFEMDSDIPLTSAQPVIFSRRSDAVFKLPKAYSSGTCVLYLDMVDDEAQDAVPTGDVLLGGIYLATKCAGANEPRLGGVISVGSRNLLHMVIFGRMDSGNHGVS